MSLLNVPVLVKLGGLAIRTAKKTTTFGWQTLNSLTNGVTPPLVNNETLGPEVPQERTRYRLKNWVCPGDRGKVIGHYSHFYPFRLRQDALNEAYGDGSSHGLSSQSLVYDEKGKAIGILVEAPMSFHAVPFTKDPSDIAKIWRSGLESASPRIKKKYGDRGDPFIDGVISNGDEHPEEKAYMIKFGEGSVPVMVGNGKGEGNWYRIFIDRPKDCTPDRALGYKTTHALFDIATEKQRNILRAEGRGHHAGYNHIFVYRVGDKGGIFNKVFDGVAVMDMPPDELNPRIYSNPPSGSDTAFEKYWDILDKPNLQNPGVLTNTAKVVLYQQFALWKPAVPKRFHPWYDEEVKRHTAMDYGDVVKMTTGIYERVFQTGGLINMEVPNGWKNPVTVTSTLENFLKRKNIVKPDGSVDTIELIKEAKRQSLGIDQENSNTQIKVSEDDIKQALLHQITAAYGIVMQCRDDAMYPCFRGTLAEGTGTPNRHHFEKNDLDAAVAAPSPPTSLFNVPHDQLPTVVQNKAIIFIQDKLQEFIKLNWNTVNPEDRRAALSDFIRKAEETGAKISFSGKDYPLSRVLDFADDISALGPDGVTEQKPQWPMEFERNETAILKNLAMFQRFASKVISKSSPPLVETYKFNL